MSKKRTSLSVDEDVKMYLSQDSVNASGLVNQLVKQRMSGADGNKRMLELRLEQLNSEISDLENRLEHKENERAVIREKLTEHRTEREEKLDEAAETLEPRQLVPDNLAVQRFADELDMSFEQLITEVEDRL